MARTLELERRSLPAAMRRWLALAALALAGCAADGAAGPHADPARDARPQAIVDGARTTVRGHTVYRFDGDLWFETEEALREHLAAQFPGEVDKLAVFQSLADPSFEPTFTRGDALDILYCVSDLYRFAAPFDKAIVVDEMRAATRAWERVANVRFHYQPQHDARCDDDNAAVDFAVLPGSIPAFCAANKLGLPTWSCPIDGLELLGSVLFSSGDPQPLHRGVLVTAYDLYPNPEQPAITTTGVLTHELGHILGMRHEHPFTTLPDGLDDGCYESQTVANPAASIGFRRLTEYDRDSVMHYPQCAGAAGRDMSVSSLDGVGARRVYGLPGSWFVPLI